MIVLEGNVCRAFVDNNHHLSHAMRCHLRCVHPGKDGTISHEERRIPQLAVGYQTRKSGGGQPATRALLNHEFGLRVLCASHKLTFHSVTRQRSSLTPDRSAERVCQSALESSDGASSASEDAREFHPSSPPTSDSIEAAVSGNAPGGTLSSNAYDQAESRIQTGQSLAGASDPNASTRGNELGVTGSRREDAAVAAPTRNVEGEWAPPNSSLDVRTPEGSPAVNPLVFGLERLRESLADLVAAANRVSAAIDSVSMALEGQRPSSGSSPGAGPFNPGSSAREVTPGEPRGQRFAVQELGSELGGAKNELAMGVLRAFAQARSRIPGQPAEVALEEFVGACVRAAAQGVGFKELQLQLIAGQGLISPPPGTGPPMARRGAVDEELKGADLSSLFEAEEIRLRTLWARFVYTSLALAERIRGGLGYDEVVAPEDDFGPPDPMDGFVQQTVRLAIEDGQDLDVVLRNQRVNPPIASPAVQMMRQSQVIILMALKRGLAM